MNDPRARDFSSCCWRIRGCFKAMHYVTSHSIKLSSLAIHIYFKSVVDSLATVKPRLYFLFAEKRLLVEWPLFQKRHISSRCVKVASCVTSPSPAVKLWRRFYGYFLFNALLCIYMSPEFIGLRAHLFPALFFNTKLTAQQLLLEVQIIITASA